MKTFHWPVRVYYEDTDAGGIVYHANYLRFFERARTEMLRDYGFEQDVLRDVHGIVFAVRAVQLDYLKPAFFNEQINVTTLVTLAKKASLIFEQKMTRADDLLCSGTVRIACLDVHTMRPKAIPDFLLEHLQNEC